MAANADTVGPVTRNNSKILPLQKEKINGTKSYVLTSTTMKFYWQISNDTEAVKVLQFWPL